jgi:hypothetical protein
MLGCSRTQAKVNLGPTAIWIFAQRWVRTCFRTSSGVWPFFWLPTAIFQAAAFENQSQGGGLDFEKTYGGERLFW